MEACFDDRDVLPRRLTPKATVLALALSTLNACAMPVNLPARAGEQPGAPHRLGESPQALAAPMDDLVAKGLNSVLSQGFHPKLRHGRFSDCQPQLEQLYRNTGGKLLWTQDSKPTPQARQAIASLADAGTHGLRDEDYDAALLARWVKSLEGPQTASVSELVSFDTALSATLIRYSRALHAGRVNPRQVNFGVDSRASEEAYPRLVERLAKTMNPADLLASLEPQLPVYQRLKALLASYRAVADHDVRKDLVLQHVFLPGARQQGVDTLRQLLRATGDLPENAPEPLEADQYDPELVEAVKRFQGRHGLRADGVIGQRTYGQLAASPRQRVKQIELAMERLRWLPQPLNYPLLLVNIPSYQLHGFQQGADLDSPDLEMSVIVGQAVKQWSTPIFFAEMSHVIFRPYWNVPPGIAKEEVIPRLLRNPSYLRNSGMEIVSSSSPSAKTYAVSRDTIARLRAGSLKIRQRPGARNALGKVKFMFPNHQSIYLHDTPSHQLFNRSRRDFSHGCIRVEDPARLAEFVLGDNAGWSRGRITKAMNSAKSATVGVATPVAVYIFYLTAWVDESGKVRFYEDIYGHDEVLSRALAKGYPYSL